MSNEVDGLVSLIQDACLSVCLSTCLSFYLSVCLPVCQKNPVMKIEYFKHMERGSVEQGDAVPGVPVSAPGGKSSL